MRAEGGGVGAAVSRKSKEGLLAMRCPDSHSAVPTAGAESIFCYQVPVYTEYFPIMFFPVHNGEIIGRRVVELDAPITRCGEDLVLVDFRPGKIIEGVLCGEAEVKTAAVSTGKDIMDRAARKAT